MGDASAEEDYVMASLGWASTKKLPILFIVEDNNLSILTEKKVRRNWEMHTLARGLNMESFNISDDPMDIRKVLENYNFEYPLLLNINTHRKYWHSGAGQDGDQFDRYEQQKIELGEIANIIDTEKNLFIDELWQRQLEIQ
jgi:TPP-dependent pyruvate/acetoin dehydrogenase alpha subunit